MKPQVRHGVALATSVRDVGLETPFRGCPARSLDPWRTLRSASSTRASVDSPWPGPCIDQLPHEAVLYLGDTARQPYGPKPIGEVREYALECLDHLVDQGVKALVIACNSASAAVLRDARERYDVPVVEVILPATRRAVAATRSGRIGVICTRATAESLAYDDAFAAAPHVDADHPGLPALRRVRRGRASPAAPSCWPSAHEYLDPLAAAGVDTLILGCTHYPLLTGVISYVMGDEVTLVSAARRRAPRTSTGCSSQHGLERDAGLQPPVHRFLTTGRARGVRDASVAGSSAPSSSRVAPVRRRRLA